MTRHPMVLTFLATLACALAVIRPATAETTAPPQAVQFEGPGNQALVGYLFLPAKRTGPLAALVLLHGRGGPYSSLAKGEYNAGTLSKRQLLWGRFWADRGYAALLVDSFGPRGYPAGFPAHSHDERPDAVNEVAVRPLDAYAALAYLRHRADIDHGRIALQGWSNGGSAALATLADSTLRLAGLSPHQGFAGAIAFYPACRLQGRFKDGYHPYAPVRVFSGDNDEEVSAAFCRRFVEASHAAGGDIAISVYPGATHDFDDPGPKRQSVAANVAAEADAIPRAEAFIKALFSRPPR